MEIKSNYNKINFGSKNKYIREADDIARKAKQTFPILSATYADEFYLSLAPDNISTRSWNARNKVLKLHNKIGVMRYNVNTKKYTSTQDDKEEFTPYKNILEGIKSYKVGNCSESAIAALTALCANGFTESQRVELFLHSQYINKKNGKAEFDTLSPLDHSFVITTMNRKKLSDANAKDIIIVDPWLGFADSYSGGLARFKKIFTQARLEEITENNKENFNKMYTGKNGKAINFDDYELKQSFTMKASDFKTPYQLCRFGKYAGGAYKELVKTPQNIQAST